MGSGLFPAIDEIRKRAYADVPPPTSLPESAVTPSQEPSPSPGSAVPESYEANASDDTIMGYDEAESPLSLLERAELSLISNAKGRYKKLQEKFGKENVYAVSPEGDRFAIVKDGKIIPTDKSGDAWETTKQLVNLYGKLLSGAGTKPTTQEKEAAGDVADISKGLVDAGAQIAASLATGGVGGPLLRQAAIKMGTSGAVGGAIRGVETSLGRIKEAYDASVPEQLLDVGLDVLANALGEGVPLAVRPTHGFFKKVMESDRVKNMTSAAKDNVAFLYSAFAHQPREAIRATMDNPAIWGMAEDAIKQVPAGQSQDKAKTILKKKSIQYGMEKAKEAKTLLTSRYGARIKEAMSVTEDAATFNPKTVIESAAKPYTDAGLLIKEGDVYRLPTGSEQAKMFASNPEGKRTLTKELTQEVANIAKILNRNASRTTTTGKAATAQAFDMSRGLHEELSPFIADGKVGQLYASLSKDAADEAIETSVKGRAGDLFKTAKSEYRKSATFVKEFAAASESPAKMEAFISRLTKPDGEKVGKYMQAETVIPLLGEEGQKMLDEFYNYEYASSLIGVVPSDLSGSSVARLMKIASAAGSSLPGEVILKGGAIAAATYYGGWPGGAAASGLALMPLTPAQLKRNLATLTTGKQVLNFFKSLSPDAKTALVQSAGGLTRVASEVYQAQQDEDKFVQQLMQDSGVYGEQ